MNISSLGDLAQSYLTRKQNAEIKQTIGTLTLELSSGRISDLADSLSGDFGQLASLERSITSLDAYRISTSEAEFFMQTQQQWLEGIATGLGTSTEAMLAAANSSLSVSLNGASVNADSQFRMAVSTLNIPAAGRSLFSGEATSQPALRGAQDILNELATVISGLTTATDIENALDNWFMAPGGGYETFAYTGSTEPMEPFLVGEGRLVGPGVTALDNGIRETLKALAMGALMKEGVVTNDVVLRRQVLSRTAEVGLTARGYLTDTQAAIGVVQQQIEAQSVRTAAEYASFSIARSELVTADPFETATRLENAQFQLEALYAATARSSRMSLMDYLR